MDYLIKLLPAIITGLFLYYWQRQQKMHDDKKDRERKERDGLKDEIDSVNREVNSATMELAYATSIAVECGRKNGELKAARKAYDEAKKHQDRLAQKMMQRMN